MDIRVRQDVALETCVLERGERLGQCIRGAALAGCEQFAAIPRDGQVWMVRALAHQLEQGQYAGPGGVALSHGPALRRIAF